MSCPLSLSLSTVTSPQSDYQNGHRKKGRSAARREPSQEEQAHFILNVESPHDDHNRGATDTSMVVEYDERSVPVGDDLAGFAVTPSRSRSGRRRPRAPHSMAQHAFYGHHGPRSQQRAEPKTQRKEKRFGGMDAEEMHLVDGNEDGADAEREQIANVAKETDAEEGDSEGSPSGHAEAGRRYKQFAVRSDTDNQQAIHQEDSAKMAMHGAGPRFGRGHNSGYQILLKSSRWTRWIALAALSICFVLGVFMGFGVSVN